MQNLEMKVGTRWRHKINGSTVRILDVNFGCVNVQWDIDGVIETRIVHKFLTDYEPVKHEDISIGSVWKAVRGTNPEDVGRLIKVCNIYGDLIHWEFIDEDKFKLLFPELLGSGHMTCTSSFLYCFERVENNDDNNSNKEKNKMGNDTYLKTDKNKLEDFGTGAKREDKTGKGRYDLIPGDIMNNFEEFVWKMYFSEGHPTTCDETSVSTGAYFDEWNNIELYYDFIFRVVSFFFVPHSEEDTNVDPYVGTYYEISWKSFRTGLYKMRKALSDHYEAGAIVHGVDNWKKGIPIYGSEKGGCFLDSMRRHIDQALQGLTDEPHAIAAIWNAFGAIWTLENKTEPEGEKSL